MPKAWYAVHTISGHENKVKSNIEKLIGQHNLQDKITQIKIPTMDVAEMKNGKKKITRKRLMPGYLLIEMDMNDDTQYLVQNLPSVSTFVGSKSKPDPLTLEEVKNLFNDMRDVLCSCGLTRRKSVRPSS
jgi:transcriptional antiterminator NusG